MSCGDFQKCTHRRSVSERKTQMPPTKNLSLFSISSVRSLVSVLTTYQHCELVKVATLPVDHRRKDFEISVWSNGGGAHQTFLFDLTTDVALGQNHTERLTCGQKFTAKLSFGFHCFPWTRKTLRQSCVEHESWRSSKLDSTTDVAACGQDPPRGQASTSSLVHGRRRGDTA